jgi:hypothetical protein
VLIQHPTVTSITDTPPYRNTVGNQPHEHHAAGSSTSNATRTRSHTAFAETRHKAAAELYAVSDFNAEMVAQEFGWASPEMVTDL